MSPVRLYSSVGGILVLVTAGVVYWVHARRKTPEQREFERRQRLNAAGRITDGTVLDLQEVQEDSRPPMRLLIYTYGVAGVTYECSQDISALKQILHVDTCRIDLPASVKYDPHNPADSIVVAEGWNGLRLLTHEIPL